MTLAEAILWAFLAQGQQLWARFVCRGCGTIEIRMVTPDGCRMLNGRGEDLGAWNQEAQARERCRGCWQRAIFGVDAIEPAMIWSSE